MKRLPCLFFIFSSFFLQAQITSTECLSFKKVKIAVIGSSTAAGSGASTSDSAWVNRYRKHLQKINPENEVINLARGGYNTYRLMPHEFIPPGNRPTPDSTRNITAALAEMPDAIILNLPSNDASSGWSAAEQLSNFDSIARTAGHADVPIWIATTQPKNFSNPDLIQVQTEVRDSILNWYGDKALNFWEGLAASDGRLDSLFDSGDGTHLNDAGHRLLFERVRERMIPLETVIDPDTFNYAIVNFEPVGKQIYCGNEEVLMEIIYTNLGQPQFNDISIDVLGFTTSSTSRFTVPAPRTCEIDTVFASVTIDTIVAAIIYNNSQDSSGNQVIPYEIQRVPSPEFIPNDQTICLNETALFNFDFQNTDTVFWFDKASGGNMIASGESFQTGAINYDTTFWVEAVNGDLFYKNSLFTTEQFNRDWNGIMFDLTVAEDAIIDSISVNMFSQGTQVLEIYKKSGSLIGSELDSSQWGLYKIDTLQITNSGDYVNVPDLNLNLSANDTVGIYLQLQDPTADMNYLATTGNETIADTILSITNGTGISHDFSDTYFPRLFSGEVFYHFGNRPQGDCSSGRQPVQVNISQPTVDLPEVIYFDTGDSIRLDAGTGFSDYIWSTGSTAQSILILGDTLPGIVNSISVKVVDEFGCSASDSVRIIFFPTGTEEIYTLNYQFQPNPGSGTYHLMGDFASAKIELFNLAGQLVFSNIQNLPADFDWAFLQPGIYLLKIKTQKGIQTIRLQHLRQ